MRKQKQLLLLKNDPKEYGGELLKTRKGRRGPRPLDTKNSMHLVLRSSVATGTWSFRRSENSRKITLILKRFAAKHGVSLLSTANVGNHLHLHIKLHNRFGYKPFIRATTAAIAMAITGVSRWNRNGHARDISDGRRKTKFWDLRPYTRIVIGRTAWLHLTKYIRINQLEGMGFSRQAARVVMQWPEMATDGS